MSSCIRLLLTENAGNLAHYQVIEGRELDYDLRAAPGCGRFVNGQTMDAAATYELFSGISIPLAIVVVGTRGRGGD